MMTDSSKPKKKPYYKGGSREAPVIEHEVAEHNSQQKASNSEKPATMGKQSEPRADSKGTLCVNWICLLISGIVGGFITLSFWVGIQWMGFFPFFSAGYSVEGEKIVQIAETAKSQAEKAEEQLDHVVQELGALKTAFSSFSSQHFENFRGDEVPQEENKKALAALEEKVNALEEHAQAWAKTPQNVNAALLMGQSNKNDLAVLKQQLDNMQEEIITKNSEKNGVNTAIFVAVSALKNAVDRGGSYVNELEMVRHFLPSAAGLDLLQKTARTGLPSSAKLSADFAHVADAIAGTQNTTVPGAGFFEQIWVRTKSLVISRPVGNVEGVTPGAIAARMEAAIQAGDYEKALAEWRDLPENAKVVSADFIRQIETYLAVHDVLRELLVSIQQKSLEATKM